MSGSTQAPIPEGTPVGGYQAGATVIYRLRDEVAVPLRRDQFETLCEGGTNEARASRDLYFGAFFGALVGLFGVLATTDDTVWQPGRRGRFLFWLASLVVIVSGSFVGACIHWVRLKHIRANSPFSRVERHLSDLFDQQTPRV